MKRYSIQYVQLIEVNTKMYKYPLVDNAERIECLQYSEAFSLNEELNKSFEGREVFTRMIPPEVKLLEEDYRKYIEGFMKSHNLPNSLYAAPGEQKIPEDLLGKFYQCRERGGTKPSHQIVEVFV
jgi:hypothetical protein